VPTVTVPVDNNKASHIFTKLVILTPPLGREIVHDMAYLKQIYDKSRRHVKLNCDSSGEFMVDCGLKVSRLVLHVGFGRSRWCSDI
jgi:hypothetical protein